MAVETDARSSAGTVAEALQATVVELMGLSMAGKHAHWNVVGPTFRAVHLQLDEIVEIAREGTDRVAERLATIGLDPDGRPSTVANGARDDMPEGRMSTEVAIQDMTRHLDDLTGRLRERITRLADPDPISQGILIDIADELEKQAWMLRSQRPG